MADLLRPALFDAVPYSRPTTPSHGANPQIGFIGLGAMGFLIARNLAKYRATHINDSPPLLVWNRTVDKSVKLVELLGSDKVRIANDPEQVAQECDVIITNLGNDAVVKSIYDRFKSALEVCHTTTLFMSLRRKLSTRIHHTLDTRLLLRPALFV